MVKWGPLIVVALCARSARADDVTDLEARGEQLAKSSEYTQAIAVFKAADLRRPRAVHACMIGLAYLRRELWPQAELFLASCEKRASPGDQPPSWIDAAEHQLAAKLSAAQIPAVTILVTPADARITISSFAPDESFTPQTIHLMPGTQLVEVTADGYLCASREITIRSGEPQTITFTLERDIHVHTVRPQPPPQPQRGASKVPWVVIAGGVVLAAAAVIYDEEELQPSRDLLAHSQIAAAYAALHDNAVSEQRVTIGLFAGAAIAVGVGVALHHVLRAPELTATLGAHNGAIALGWHL